MRSAEEHRKENGIHIDIVPSSSLAAECVYGDMTVLWRYVDGKQLVLCVKWGSEDVVQALQILLATQCSVITRAQSLDVQIL